MDSPLHVRDCAPPNHRLLPEPMATVDAVCRIFHGEVVDDPGHKGIVLFDVDAPVRIERIEAPKKKAAKAKPKRRESSYYFAEDD